MRLISTVTLLVSITFLSTSIVHPKIAGDSDEGSSETSGIRCLLSIDMPKWSKHSDTRFHLRLTNTSDRRIEVNVFPVLHLDSKPWNAYSSYWGPADLQADAPARIHEKAQDGHSIEPKPQILRLPPHGELRIVLSASKIKWDKSISSLWPSRSLFDCVSAGEYELHVDLGKDLRSNKVAVLVAPK